MTKSYFLLTWSHTVLSTIVVLHPQSTLTLTLLTYFYHPYISKGIETLKSCCNCNFSSKENFTLLKPEILATFSTECLKNPSKCYLLIERPYKKIKLQFSNQTVCFDVLSISGITDKYIQTPSHDSDCAVYCVQKNLFCSSCVQH